MAAARLKGELALADQTGLQRDRDRVLTVPGAERAHDRADVLAHRLDGETHLPADHLVRDAVGQPLEQQELGRREDRLFVPERCGSRAHGDALSPRGRVFLPPT